MSLTFPRSGVEATIATAGMWPVVYMEVVSVTVCRMRRFVAVTCGRGNQ